MSQDRSPTNPFSTGHGGARFETLVAASYLISLLREEAPRGLLGGICSAVRLQQRNRGHDVDDVVVTAKEGTRTHLLALQAKASLTFTDNPNFRYVVSDCWRQFLREGSRPGTDLVGIALGEKSNIGKVRHHLQQLLRWATTSEDSSAFIAKTSQFRQQRDFLDLFQAVLTGVIGERPSPDQLWDFLKSFVVIPFDFDSDGSRDSQQCLNAVLGILGRSSTEQAQVICSALFELVSRYAAAGGELSRDTVLRELPPSIQLRTPSLLRRDLRSAREAIAAHLQRQIAREKNSRRYIPGVFVESSNAKYDARSFVNPGIFQRKVADDVRRMGIAHVSSALTSLSLDAPEPSLVARIGSGSDLYAVEADCDALLSQLSLAVQGLATAFQTEKRAPATPNAHSLIGAEREQQDPFQTVNPLLAMRMQQMSSRLRPLRSRVMYLLGGAGQGKTNFVCNLVETVIQTRSQLCLFFPCQDLNAADPAKLDEHLVRSVFGERYSGSLDAALEDLRLLSEADKMPVILIVDGINEHTRPHVFAVHLAKLIERLVSTGFVRTMVTCRSEYFLQRFGGLSRASFAQSACTIEELERHMEDAHKSYLLDSYLAFFNIECRAMSARARTILTGDPLLLRMFCEAYGDHSAGGITELPLVSHIYKEEVFRKYYERVIGAAERRHLQTEGTSVGARSHYRRLLSRIVELMLERGEFSNIPVSCIDHGLHAPLDLLINEDVIIRKDLADRAGLGSQDDEVISFTFDEFRDFLLADYLLATLAREDMAQFVAALDRLTDPSSPVAEGLSNYIFVASRREGSAEIRAAVSASRWYRDVFLECLFSMPDSLVEDADIALVEEMFLEDITRSAFIIVSLVERDDIRVYPKLNVTRLPQMLSRLDPDAFARLVEPAFTGEGPYTPHDLWPIDSFCDYTRESVEGETTADEVRSSLMELLLYLLPVRTGESSYPAPRTFLDLAEERVDVAVGLLKKHSTLTGPMWATVWHEMSRLDPASRLSQQVALEAAQLVAEADSRRGERSSGWSPVAAAVAFLASRSGGVTRSARRTRDHCDPGEDPTRWSAPMIVPVEAPGPGGQSRGFLILADRELTRGEYLDGAQVRPGSYAAELAESLYDMLFTSSVDLAQEHDEYYAPEYDTLGDFMFWMYSLPRKLADSAAEAARESCHLRYNDEATTGDSLPSSFLEDRVLRGALLWALSDRGGNEQ